MPQLHNLAAIRVVKTGLDADTVRHRCVDDLTVQKLGEIDQIDARYVEGRCGSQVALHLEGSWIANMEDFPVVATIELHPDGGGGIEAPVTVVDDLGFGLMFGVHGKSQKAIDQLADVLAGSLSGEK